MNYWFVVPAAGTGRRFGSDIPKQYLEIAGKKVIERTLERLLSMAPAGVVVAINGSDRDWNTLPLSRHPLVHTVEGGAERPDSVRLALSFLEERLDPGDWVLVHDVARPCITVGDISRLLETLAEDDVGGILAAPVSDTIKRGDAAGGVEATEDRSRLWAAMTPQMFRFGLLVRALDHCAGQGVVPTDEAMAVELLGLRPRLVAGRGDNIKVTRPEDRAIAETILRWQQNDE